MYGIESPVESLAVIYFPDFPERESEQENIHRAFEGKIPDFFADQLTNRELEDFLEHIEKCSSCYDELATYFIVHKAMQQLDEKQEDSVLDFKGLLEEDIRKSRRYIRKKKFHRAIAAVAVCVLIAALVVFLVFVILELKEGI